MNCVGVVKLKKKGVIEVCIIVYVLLVSSSIKRFNCVAERCSSEVFLASVECLELIRLDTANYATALEAESNRGFIQLASEEHGVAPCLMLSLLLNDTFP